MTKSQLHILQHSLGVDQYGQGNQYRNHFVTGQGCDDWNDCVQLESEGLMQRQKVGGLIPGGDVCFHVTPKGVDVVAFRSPVPPKLTRSQRRYRAYRNSAACDSGISFLDFLRSIPWRREQGYDCGD